MTSKHALKSFSFWACCLFTPIILLAIICTWTGIYPFGPESFLAEDEKYQYIDLFTWFRRVLLGESSAFYIANTGMGANAWGLVSYYLSSPFNMLLVLFDEDHLVDFFWVITALKLGCVQVSSAWYLTKRFNSERLIAFALALCFTWSSWTATQLRNPLWLDALILLPIAAYGVYLLIKQSRWIPLAITLALAIITCWYTAYMLIIFLSLLAALEMVAFSTFSQNSIKKTVLHRVMLFILAVVMALLLAAFTFSPTVLAMLGGSKGASFTSLTATSFHQLAAGFFIGNWSSDTPQHYAGTLLLVTTAGFFLCSTIQPRLKAAALLALVLMIASAYFTPLLYVWSGFRMPYGFYCRITFLTIFLALWLAGFTSSELLAPQSNTKIVVIAAATVSLTTLIVLVAGMFVRTRFAIITVAMCVFFAVLFIGYRKLNFLPKRHILIPLALCVCVFAELLYGAHVNWILLRPDYTQDYHNSYVSSSRDQLNELQSLDNGLYRLDKTYTRAGAAALNEGAALDYLSLSTYASSQDISAVNMLNMLGYSIEREFSMRYADSVLVMDSLLGVKYVSAHEKPVGFKDVGLMTVDGINGVGTAKFYENPYALALGYGVSSSAVDLALNADENPFERQNKLVNALLGKTNTLYDRLDVEGAFLSPGYYQYAVEVPAGKIGYVYTSVPTGDSVQLTIDDRAPVTDNWRWRHTITALGDPDGIDSMHQVAISTGSSPSTSTEILHEGASCLFYSLNFEAFESAISQLKEHEVSFASFESGHIEASYNADSNGYVLISIPATKGWHISVNGSKVDYGSLCNGGLMLIPVSSGHNAISMRFTPPGLYIGCLISALAVAALIVAGSKSHRKKCKSVVDDANQQ